MREPGETETSAMTSAVGCNPLPESLSGPCRRLRYHELNTHKVTKEEEEEKDDWSTIYFE